MIETSNKQNDQYQPGDVFLVLDTEPRAGWRGAVVQALNIALEDMRVAVYYPGPPNCETQQMMSSVIKREHLEFIGCSKIICKLPAEAKLLP